MNNKVIVLRGGEAEKILQTATDKKTIAILSYLSKGKWHVAKVLMNSLIGNQISVESTALKKKQHPLNIQVNQPVGLSFKYEYGKFVFDTTVVALEPPSEQEADKGWGGKILLAIPDQIEVVQRRSYFRVNVPKSLKVKVVLWHRSGKRQAKKRIPHEVPEETNNYCQGRLVDISAGGAQILVPYPNDAGSSASIKRQSEGCMARSFSVGQLEFKKGQFVGVRFTPMPYETPLILSAQIRNILPTEDGKRASLGLQIVGLEASPEGRAILNRLISIVEQYYQINQSGARQRDIRPIQSMV